MLGKIRLPSLRVFGFTSLFLASFGLIIGQSNSGDIQPSEGECTSCHRVIGDHWINSAHGQAATNEEFIAAWDEQGNPPVCMTCHATGYEASSQTWETLGVSCTTCHTPSGESHPDKVMLTDVSSRLCGNCHLETFSQWQDSAHGIDGKTCNQCHNAHTTSLKTEKSEELCVSCHREKVHSFELTDHAANGLTCIDCHLSISEGDLGEGHGRREHTFEVDLATCTECHGEGLHSPSQITGIDSQDQHEGFSSADPAQQEQSTEPEQVSPIGFTVLGLLIGVGFGMVLAPWLEKWFLRFRR